jgi:thiol-disulfide isomerase/thioredoxin
MKLKAKLRLIVVAIAALAVTAWLVVSSPFGHGIIVGLLIGVSSLIPGMLVLGRVVRRKLSKRLEPPPLPTGSWDYAMEVTDLEGEPVQFADFAGKVLILNFWATRCAPCIVELPSLARLLDATAEFGVHFGFVTSEDPRVVRQFVEKQGLQLPIYVLSGEPPACFKSRGVPTTFVVDQVGRIALRHVGAARWDDESVVAFVRGLAAVRVAQGSA